MHEKAIEGGKNAAFSSQSFHTVGNIRGMHGGGTHWEISSDLLSKHKKRFTLPTHQTFITVPFCLCCQTKKEMSLDKSWVNMQNHG